MKFREYIDEGLKAGDEVLVNKVVGKIKKIYPAENPKIGPTAMVNFPGKASQSWAIKALKKV